MNKTAENITSLSQNSSDNKEEGWLKTKAKCFMQYVTVVIKVITLIEGALNRRSIVSNTVSGSSYK